MWLLPQSLQRSQPWLQVSDILNRELSYGVPDCKIINVHCSRCKMYGNLLLGNRKSIQVLSFHALNLKICPHNSNTKILSWETSTVTHFEIQSLLYPINLQLFMPRLGFYPMVFQYSCWISISPSQKWTAFHA